MTNQTLMKMVIVVLALAIWTIGSGLVVAQTFGQGNESLGINQTGNQTGNQSLSPVSPGLGGPGASP